MGSIWKSGGECCIALRAVVRAVRPGQYKRRYIIGPSPPDLRVGPIRAAAGLAGLVEKAEGYTIYTPEQRTPPTPPQIIFSRQGINGCSRRH